MSALVHLIETHLTAAGFGGGALLIAAICTMPPQCPQNFQQFWTWMRDALQTVVPAARHPQAPTQPVEPAQTK